MPCLPLFLYIITHTSAGHFFYYSACLGTDAFGATLGLTHTFGDVTVIGGAGSSTGLTDDTLVFVQSFYVRDAGGSGRGINVHLISILLAYCSCYDYIS